MLNDVGANTAVDTYSAQHCTTVATKGYDVTAADEHSVVVDGNVHVTNTDNVPAIAAAAAAKVLHEATTVAHDSSIDATAVSKESNGNATHITEPQYNTNDASNDAMDFTFNEDLFSYDDDNTTVSHHAASGRRSDRRRLTITSASIEHNDNDGACVGQQTDDNDTITQQHNDIDDTDVSDSSYGLNGCGISSQLSSSSSSIGSSSQPDTSFRTAMHDTIAQQPQPSTAAVTVTANTVTARSSILSVSTETAAMLDGNDQNDNGGATVSDVTDDNNIDDVTAPDVDMLTYRRGSLFGTSNDDSNSNNSNSSRAGTPTGLKIDIPKYNNSGNGPHQGTGTSVARFNSTAVVHHSSNSRDDSAAVAVTTSTSDACIQAGNGKILNDADYAELYTTQELEVMHCILSNT
eukprot:10970-Heterococcus_DN1.PRE.1